jgi:hypothetical protein
MDASESYVVTGRGGTDYVERESDGWEGSWNPLKPWYLFVQHLT